NILNITVTLPSKGSQRTKLSASLTNDDGLPRKIAKRIITFQTSYTSIFV
ncbi:14859_t:CDS:1, partial [Funneliformis caledonium]